MLHITCACAGDSLSGLILFGKSQVMCRMACARRLDGVSSQNSQKTHCSCDHGTSRNVYLAHNLGWYRGASYVSSLGSAVREGQWHRLAAVSSASLCRCGWWTFCWQGCSRAAFYTHVFFRLDGWIFSQLWQRSEGRDLTCKCVARKHLT